MAQNGNKKGYLEIIIGPMFSSKTTTILQMYKQCVFCNISVSIINHSIDQRYHNTMISSHDKIMAPCFQVNKLSDIWRYNSNNTYSNNISYNDYEILRNSDVILINEGQFFDDLFEVVNEMVNCGKKLYVCGLDGDFEKNKFGQILDLIPNCDKVNKLTSLCSLCKNGTKAIFTMRLTNEKEQTIVGITNYIPVCRECYKTQNKLL